MILSTESTQLILAPDTLSDVAVGDELQFRVTVQSESGQVVRGGILEIVSVDDGNVLQPAQHASVDDQATEAEPISVMAPVTLGRHEWLIRFPAQEIDGRQYGESTCGFSFETRPQRTGLTVWGVPSTVRVGSRFRLSVGAKSIGGWDVGGARIEVRDASGTVIESSHLSEKPWAGTALKWTELELTAPEDAGKVTWETIFAASELKVPHIGSSAKINITTVPAPNTRVGVRVVDQEGEPLDDARVAFGVHRAKTDSLGLAHLEVSDGTYALTVWKSEYEMVRKLLDVTQDEDVEIALTKLPEDLEPWERGY